MHHQRDDSIWDSDDESSEDDDVERPHLEENSNYNDSQAEVPVQDPEHGSDIENVATVHNNDDVRL